MAKVGRAFGLWACLCVWAGVGTLSGCRSDVESLGAHCVALEGTVSTIRDCERLGSQLQELAEDHAEWMRRLRDMEPPTGEAQRAWADALAPCLRARLEASAGLCRSEPNVANALQTMSAP